MPKNIPCHCGSSKQFSVCCEPYLTDKAKPVTAEQLMRSRYSAFVTQNADYLLQTWHIDQRPKQIDFDQNTKWLRLNVKRCKAGLTNDSTGWVEFVAHFKVTGKAERIEELSYFIKENNQWVYVAAEAKDWDDLI